MKKSIVFITAAAMILTLAACGNAASSSAPSSESSSVSASTAPSESASESASASAAVEQMVEGKIVEAAMNSITIKTADGVSLSFSTTDADKTACNGLLVDSMVKVYYTGTITDTDTTAAVVTRMMQDAAVASDATSLPASSEAAPVASSAASSVASSVAASTPAAASASSK